MSSLECMIGYIAHEMSVQRHNLDLNNRLYKRAIHLAGLPESEWHFVKAVSQVPDNQDGVMTTKVTIDFTDGKQFVFKTKESMLAI